MNRHDLLKLRIKKYVTTNNLKALAEDYLSRGSGYFIQPELYKNRATVLDEMDREQVVDNNYDAILLKVDRWLS